MVSYANLAEDYKKIILYYVNGGEYSNRLDILMTAINTAAATTNENNLASSLSSGISFKLKNFL